MTISRALRYFALAAVVAGVIMNLDDIRRYVRISTM